MANKLGGGKGKTNRKHGRNAEGCKAYKLSNRRITNKIRKLKKHCKAMPNDVQSIKHLKEIL